jgi:hypothetical protein
MFFLYNSNMIEMVSSISVLGMIWLLQIHYQKQTNKQTNKHDNTDNIAQPFVEYTKTPNIHITVICIFQN